MVTSSTSFFMGKGSIHHLRADGKRGVASRGRAFYGGMVSAPAVPTPSPNLYLAGFMGTGKSMLGRKLAEQKNMKFLDSDEAIARAVGKPVAKIFAEHGEAEFRRLEREFVERGHPDRGQVVALGGGLVTQPGVIELLRAKGVLVCLFASVETILQRTRGNSARPLLNVPDPAARVRELLAERDPYYRRAGTCIMTDGRSFNDLLAHLDRIYRREARAYPPK
jgi:shikimate kinase